MPDNGIAVAVVACLSRSFRHLDDPLTTQGGTAVAVAVHGLGLGIFGT